MQDKMDTILFLRRYIKLQDSLLDYFIEVQLYFDEEPRFMIHGIDFTVEEVNNLLWYLETSSTGVTIWTAITEEEAKQIQGANND